MIDILDPKKKKVLKKNKYFYLNKEVKYPIVNNIPRFVTKKNYTENFGYQWNKFSKTQLFDKKKIYKEINKTRFFRATNWKKKDLAGKNILEAGSGAGRFSEVVLNHTGANLYSIDFSSAVEANYKNNYKKKYKRRFHLFQASLYEMPFFNKVFDKIFCFGVLQHTPDIKKTIFCLVEKLKVNGHIVIDFYPYNGFWTYFHAKYIFRIFTKNLSNKSLINLIEKNIDFLIKIYFILKKMKLGFLTRFLPIVDIEKTLPKFKLQNLKESIILDTFDMLSPKYDSPQKIKDIVKIFQKFNVKVTFSGFVKYKTFKVAVVRGVKIK